MMHEAWCSIEEVPFWFSRSFVKFQGHMGQNKLPILTRIECFWTVCVTSVWIHWWLWMMHKAWRSIEEVHYCFFRSSNKFQGRTGQKIEDLNLIWVRLLSQSAIKSLRFALFFQILLYLHIEAWTKWPLFCRRHSMYVFSWKKSFIFWLRFHRSLFLWVKLTIIYGKLS